jgi:hypothetical protein
MTKHEGLSMNAIRIRKKLDSDTLHLPELKSLLGKTVEIIVLEESPGPQVTPGTGNFAAFAKLAEKIRTDYDFDALQRQREFDLLHASDHLP